MKKKLLVAKLLLIISCYSFSQGVGIGTNTPDVSAALDITAANKGLLIPRMSTSAINAITNPATGLMIYDSVANQLMINLGTPAAPNFQRVTGNGSNGAWSLTGNSGTNPANQFIGTTDNQPLRFRINNIQAGELHPATGNIFWGSRAGRGNTTGFSNVAIGTDALNTNTTIGNLIAIGDSALFNNTGTDNGTQVGVGIANLAIGHQSLFNNTTGQFNMAIGHQSLFSNTTAGVNTAIGFQALFSNTTGNSNTAVGHQSLFSNITGSHNTAVGFLSLQRNLIGDNNTATGWQSLHANTSGDANTAVGTTALFSNTTGSANTAVGNGALTNSTTGSNNTAVGELAISSRNTGDNNTAVGNSSLNNNTSGVDNTAVGLEALKANNVGNFNTAIGKRALLSNTVGESNTAIGENAMVLNIGGVNNVAVGDHALQVTTNSLDNTAVGYHAALDFNLGNNNTFIGAEADADRAGLTNATALGAGAIVNASNKVRIGNSSVTVIEGQVPFTTPSDGRYKYQVKEDVKGLDFIVKLRPVTYQFDVKRFDEQQNHSGENKSAIASNNIMQASYNEASGIRRTGFIAQEVEKAADATGYNFSGIIKPKTEQDHYSLSYESFVVPLVKAVQEQQQMISELKKINSLQKNLNENLLNRLEKIESSLEVKK